MTSAFSTAYRSSIATASTFTTKVCTPTASSSPTFSPIPSNLSPTTAIGIGVAAGVVGSIVLLTAALFVYRCWKVRRSPSVRYYEQARMWKGFTPATPNTARTTLVESRMADIYFAELRSPGTPGCLLSPPLDGHERNWPGTPGLVR